MHAGDDEAADPRRRSRTPQPDGPPHLPWQIALGRTALGLVPALWVVAYLTRPIWLGTAPPEGDELPDHPLLVAIVVVTAWIAAFAPLIVLPVGVARAAWLEPTGTLWATTALGRRHVDLGRLRQVGGATLHGRGTNAYYVLLRDWTGHRLILWLGSDLQAPGVPSHWRGTLDAAIAADPSMVSVRGRMVLGIPPRPALLERLRLTIVAYAVGLPAWVLVWFAAIVILGMGWMVLT